MMRPLAVLVLGFVLQAGSPSPTAIRVVILGAPSGEMARGLEFGALESAQTAKLLGFSVERVSAPDPGIYGFVIADGGRPPAGRPAVYLSAAQSPADSCRFFIGAADVNGAVLWHASLDRFGASELNERFTRRYRSPMTGESWAGWAAMKALVESALRRGPDEDPCRSLARLRFDGHKGRPLYFDPATRILAQPRYILKDGRVIGEHE